VPERLKQSAKGRRPRISPGLKSRRYILTNVKSRRHILTGVKSRRCILADYILTDRVWHSGIA
jgi:hypothetical protein